MGDFFELLFRFIGRFFAQYLGEHYPLILLTIFGVVILWVIVTESGGRNIVSPRKTPPPSLSQTPEFTVKAPPPLPPQTPPWSETLHPPQFLIDATNSDKVTKEGNTEVISYLEAANQGDPTAQYRLGLMYDTGKGVPKNNGEAVKWFRKAAEQGHAAAQAFLGLMYAYGQGVPVDKIEAYAWTNISAVSGDQDAIKYRSELEREIGRDRTLIAQQRTIEILKAVKAKNANFQK